MPQVTIGSYTLGKSGRRKTSKNRILGFNRLNASYATGPSNCFITTSSGPQCFQGAITNFYDCNCFYTYYPNYTAISQNCPSIGSQCGNYY
jgi:hypothetical protein